MTADLESQTISRASQLSESERPRLSRIARASISDAEKGNADSGDIPLPMIAMGFVAALLILGCFLKSSGSDEVQNLRDSIQQTERNAETKQANEADDKETDDDPQSFFHRAEVQITGGVVVSVGIYGLAGYCKPEWFFCGYCCIGDADFGGSSGGATPVSNDLTPVSEDLTPVSESAWAAMVGETAALTKLWDLPKDAFSDADRAAALSSVGPDDWPKTLHKAALLAALKTHKMPSENTADAELLQVFTDAKEIFDMCQLVISFPGPKDLSTQFTQGFADAPFAYGEVSAACFLVLIPFAGKSTNKFEFMKAAKAQPLFKDLHKTERWPAISKDDLIEWVWNELFKELGPRRSAGGSD